jgi:hypothetical protein
MHGGAAGSGAPKGKRNGKYRHGGFTTEAIDERRRLASLIRDSRDFLSRLRYSDALNEDEVSVELSSIILRRISWRSKHPASAADKAAGYLTDGLREKTACR